MRGGEGDGERAAEVTDSHGRLVRSHEGDGARAVNFNADISLRCLPTRRLWK